MTRTYQRATPEERMQIRNDVFWDFIKWLDVDDLDPKNLWEDPDPENPREEPAFPKRVYNVVKRYLRKTLDDEMPLIPDR